MTPAERLAANKAKTKLPKDRNVVHDCRLAEMRLELGLSLKAVGEAIGMTQAGLWNIEHGTDPMLTTARKIAKFYGKTIDEIWVLSEICVKRPGAR
jgi:DNA-binding XRE family transcriptional regulator